MSFGQMRWFTAIIKARSDGIRKGDRPAEPLELIVRGYFGSGEYFEEKVLLINYDQSIDVKTVKKALSQTKWRKKSTTGKTASQPDADATGDALVEHLRHQLERDPLDRFPAMDAKTLNFIGELALGEADSGTFTPRQLAEKFHAHLENIFWNRVCDKDGSRSNMIGCLETSLTMTSFSGVASKKYPGYIPFGTVLIK
jgi:hypothetical protein